MSIRKLLLCIHLSFSNYFQIITIFHNYYYGCELFLFQLVNFGKNLQKREDFHSEALFSECVGRGKRCK